MNGGDALPPDTPATPGTPPAPNTPGAPGSATPGHSGASRTGTTPPGEQTAPHTPAARDADRTAGPAGTRDDVLPRLEIIAHRGEHSRHRENTLAALRAAVDAGADRIETDVRRTRDGILVLHHDPAIELPLPPRARPAPDIHGREERRSDPHAPGIHGREERRSDPHAPDIHVGDKRTPRRLLEQTHADACAVARDAGFELCSLSDALEELGRTVRWDIELKDRGAGPEIAAAIRRQLPPNRFVITSFHDDVLRRVRRAHPDLEVGLILGTDRPPLGPLTRISELFPIRRAHACGAAVLVPQRRFLRFGFLRNVRRFKGRVWVWDVNSDRDLRRLIGTPGVHGLITDRTARARELVDLQRQHENH